MTSPDNSADSPNPSDAPPTAPADDGAADAAAQRDALLESQRNANRQQPRNFKEDALTDKIVHVDPEGTGPSPIDTLDPPKP